MKNFLLNYFFNKINIYIFCYWVWILSLLFLCNLFPFSLLYSSFISLIVTIPYQLLIKKDIIKKKIFTIFIETLIYVLNYYKHFHYYKFALFEPTQIIFNVALIIVYNIFLIMNNTNMYKHYFINNLRLKK